MSSRIIDKLHRFPTTFLCCISILWLIDIITLYSVSGGDFSLWAAKQLTSMMIGFVIIILLGVLDIRHIFNYSYLFYLFALLLLVGADIIGYTAMGAQRWIKIGGVTLQPSELAKPALIIDLARYYHDIHSNAMPKLKTQLIPAALIIAPVLLVLRQPNLGTATILTAIGGMIMLLAGVRVWKFILLGIGMLASIPLGWNFLHPYQKRRVLTFLNPEQDPLGAGYNIIQSKIAIGSGSIAGKGFMQGSQSQLSFLPEKQTDFIFTVIAEEYGFLGSTFVLAMFGMIAYLGMKLASENRHQFSRLVISGFTFMLVLHVFINIAMISGMIPAVGIPLPFLSYGGSNLLAMCIGVGLVVNGSVYNKMNLQ